MDPDTILRDLETAMNKSLEYLKSEIKGVRTGRASPGMVEHIKVEAYGGLSDIKSIAAVSVPEASQLLIKPFDGTLVNAIKTAIEKANLGINPMVDGKSIRLNIPASSADRRAKEAARVKKMGEDCKITLRNSRRDANKHAEGIAKAIPEDELKQLKDEIQKLLKKFEDDVDSRCEAKSKEVMTL